MADREASLAAIRAGLARIGAAIAEGLRRIQINLNASQDGTRIVVRQGSTQIKIEVTPVLRGIVFPPEIRSVIATVEDTFGFAEMQLVSFADLYAGKLVAALDRQHPRDLFDVRYLFANEGIDATLFRAFLVYIISHGRPAHEVLTPAFKDIAQTFEKEFVGMTVAPVSLDDLLESRRQLVAEIQARLADDRVRAFLMSFHELQPDWPALGLDNIADLPAVRWKLINLERLRAEQPAKYQSVVKDLARVLK